MKKIIYIMLSTILGVMLSFIAHAIFEVSYILYSYKKGVILTGYLNGYCFIPTCLSVGLLVLGIIGGIALGFWWWNIVYVQKKHWRMKK